MFWFGDLVCIRGRSFWKQSIVSLFCNMKCERLVEGNMRESENSYVIWNQFSSRVSS